MAVKNVSTDLDNESLIALRQARAAQAQLRNIGMPVQPLEPQPLKQQKPVVVQTEPVVNYDNFIEIQNLPSKGLFYQNKVYGQGLKMEDIIQIQSMDDFNLISNFTEIFARRLRGVDPEEILTADELYIALWLRASSFPDSDHYSNGFICSNDDCDFKMIDPAYKIPFQQITFSADNMPDDLFQKYKETGYVEDVLPESGKNIKIELRRRYHSRLINEVLSEIYEDDKAPESYYINLLQMASIVNIDDITLENSDSLKMRVDIIKNLSTKDSYKLIKCINDNALVVEPVINHICPKCGEVTKTRGYPFRIEKYLPVDY